MAARKTGFVVGAVAGVGVAAAALAGVGLRMSPASAEQPMLVRAANTQAMFAPPPGAPMSFADIFEQVSPAVVSIDVTSRVDANAFRRLPGFENFPFDIVPRQPRGGERGQEGQEGGPPLPRAQASGSGFFISPDGYVVTNNHVVENAEKITVTLKDGKEVQADVIGRDEGTDLAVLKVRGGGRFPFVNFENSATPRVGDWVITVGNPFGLGGTATAGIISSYGRDIGDTFVDYIQIDAPINRGNSGGPTFDIYGRVIGVNTAIFSPSGGSVGIGFAIPADVADRITKQLISGGKIVRGYIGATIQNFTDEMAEAQGLNQKGAIVSDLVPGGPAERAGLQTGDVVVGINGVPVTSSSELTRNVALAQAGDVLRLDVIRDGKRQRIDIRSGVRPSEKELAAVGAGNDDDNPATPDAPSVQRPVVLGMGLAPLDAALRQRYSIPASVRGAVVTSVRAESDAGEKGLRAGDVIVSATNKAVSTAADVAAAVDAAKRADRPSVLLGVSRGGRTLYVPIKIAD
ncbi:MAG TPA: Do family serine endopeptidase [Caulobacteraceae bacterium]|nr:Do family serine endopeptidase [Caulobacteraceae bacterium]